MILKLLHANVLVILSISVHISCLAAIDPPAPKRAKQKNGEAGHNPESNTRRDEKRAAPPPRKKLIRGGRAASHPRMPK